MVRLSAECSGSLSTQRLSLSLLIIGNAGNDVAVHVLQEQVQELQSFLQLAESLDGQAASNSAFFQHVLDRRIPQQLARYMTDLFATQTPSEDISDPDASEEDPPSDSHNDSESDASVEASHSVHSVAASSVFCDVNSHQWMAASKRPGLLYALQLLRALVSHHEVGPPWPRVASTLKNCLLYPSADRIVWEPCLQTWKRLLKPSKRT